MDDNIQHHAPIPVYRVAGSARERGEQIGKLSASQVQHSLKVYRRTFELCDISWQQAVARARQCHAFSESICPEGLEELAGIASGAAVDLDSLLALNCRTEILPADFLSRALATGTGAAAQAPGPSPPFVAANECTSFAMAREGEAVWLAQNWDWFGLQRAAVCVVDSTLESGLRHLTVTEAGMLAKIGVNSAGFGITLNILRSAQDGEHAGVPVHFLLRRLLDCSSVAEAKTLLSTCRFGSSSNVMVADCQGEIASFELSPSGVSVLDPDDGSLCHTNHFLNADLAEHDIGRPGNQSTLNRLSTAQHSVPAARDFHAMHALLSDTSDGLESICRFADPELPDIAQIETVVGVIMNLTTRTLSVSAAQPSITDFEHHTLN